MTYKERVTIASGIRPSGSDLVFISSQRSGHDLVRPSPARTTLKSVSLPATRFSAAPRLYSPEQVRAWASLSPGRASLPRKAGSVAPVWYSTVLGARA